MNIAERLRREAYNPTYDGAYTALLYADYDSDLPDEYGDEPTADAFTTFMFGGAGCHVENVDGSARRAGEEEDCCDFTEEAREGRADEEEVAAEVANKVRYRITDPDWTDNYVQIKLKGDDLLWLLEQAIEGDECARATLLDHSGDISRTVADLEAAGMKEGVGMALEIRSKVKEAIPLDLVV